METESNPNSQNIAGLSYLCFPLPFPTSAHLAAILKLSDSSSRRIFPSQKQQNLSVCALLEGQLYLPYFFSTGPSTQSVKTMCLVNVCGKKVLQELLVLSFSACRHCHQVQYMPVWDICLTKRTIMCTDLTVKGIQLWPLLWKTKQWPQDWKRSVFSAVSKKGNAKECSNYCIIALISHSSKVMLKILQARLQQYMNQELPDVQASF